MLNGQSSHLFQSRRGIRQGDPMSPLLFVIGMEYLSRILKVSGRSSSFNYHSKCKKLRLNHLIFADDLMLMCKGDSTSIQVLVESIDTFSKASGLNANSIKSALFLAGLCNTQKKETIFSVQVPHWLATSEISWCIPVLHKIGITSDDTCPLCGEHSESVNHLLFVCEFSKKCLDATMTWLGSNVIISSISNLTSKKWRVLVARRRIIICTALSCLIYHIWQCRNVAIWQAKVKSIETVIKNIKIEVKARSSLICAKEDDKDASWIHRTINHV